MPAFLLRLETLADLRSYILAPPEREQARWVGVVAELLKAAEQWRVLIYRAGGVLTDSAWGVRRWTYTEGPGQDAAWRRSELKGNARSDGPLN